MSAAIASRGTVLGTTNDYRRGVGRARKLADELGVKVTLGINDERHPYAGGSFGHYKGKAYVLYTGAAPPFVRPGVGVPPGCKKGRIP
jgi:hypothetical protein